MVAQAARASGLTVPRDLSLICFQGKQDSSPLYSGPRVDFLQMGRQAVALLTTRHKTPRRERIPFVWVEGKTLAPLS